MVHQNEKKENEDIVLYIRIQYRRNASWQGTIQWLNGRKKSTFRSVLELGNLIKDARQKVSGGTNNKASSWKDKESAS